MQTYGPQNLFEHGREIEIPQEVTGGKKQRRKGKGSDATQATCEHCAKRFTPHRGTAGRYCSKQCMHDFRIKQEPEWLKCSGCLAKLGIGMDKTAQIFRTTKQRVLAHWRKHGIKACPPKIGSWLLYAQRAKSQETKEKGWWGTEEDGRAWMSEYKAPNVHWGYEWHKQTMKRKYDALSEEEKIRRNRRCMEMTRKRFEKNPEAKEKNREYMKEWANQNKAKVRSYIKKSTKKRKQIDPGFKIQCNLRRRFKEIMGKAKNGGTHHFTSLVGCSTQQLAKHLESNFKRGMTWDNYGTHWHVDHTIPCAAFDHSDENQRRQCWHWSNLKPMGAVQNMKKSDTITNPQMNLLLCASH